MWKLIFKILIGIYLIVATYFAWQYLTHREELAICLDFPKERFIEFWEDQKAAVQTEDDNEEEEVRVGSESGELEEIEKIASGSGSFWENTKASFFELIDRLRGGMQKAEEVASESAAIVEEGKAVASQSQDLYDRTQVLLNGVKGGVVE